jgi:hypothetical protein
VLFCREKFVPGHL